MPNLHHQKHRGSEQIPQEEDADDEAAVIVDGLQHVQGPTPTAASSFSRMICGDGSKQSALLRLLFVFIVALVVNIVVTVRYRQTSGRGVRNKSSRMSAMLNGALIPLWKPLPNSDATITKIAFGSCNSQKMPQPHWDTIATECDPDLFLLMGDNVYGDCDEDDESCWNLREAYRKMADHPSVQGGAAELAVFATLDDHDYGKGDCHSDNPFKDLAREMFAEFFDIPIRELPDDGVYRSRTWGPPGQRLQVILLDTRYSRSPFSKTGRPESPYTPSIKNSTQEQQMLSETQWKWLKQELEESADIRLIVSSIQVLNNGTGFEAWRQLPAERDRLYDLIRHKRVILLTGDRHTGGLYEESNHGLVEVTASSFTHTIPLGTYQNCSTSEGCDEVDECRVGDFVRENHFGSIEIDWQAEMVTVALQRVESSYGSMYKKKHKNGKYSDAGEILLSKEYSFSELK